MMVAMTMTMTMAMAMTMTTMGMMIMMMMLMMIMSVLFMGTIVIGFYIAGAPFHHEGSQTQSM